MPKPTSHQQKPHAPPPQPKTMEEQLNGLVFKNELLSTTLLATLNDMRQSGQWCDLRLEIAASSPVAPPSDNEKVNDPPNEEETENGNAVFPVHRCLVAAACKSLAVLADEGMEHAVLANLNSHYVGLCLNFIYGKEVFVPHAHVEGLLTCAQQLQIEYLVELCEEGKERVQVLSTLDIKAEEMGVEEHEAANEVLIDETDIMVDEDLTANDAALKNDPANNDILENDTTENLLDHQDYQNENNANEVIEADRNEVLYDNTIKYEAFEEDPTENNVVVEEPTETDSLPGSCLENTESIRAAVQSEEQAPFISEPSEINQNVGHQGDETDSASEAGDTIATTDSLAHAQLNQRRLRATNMFSCSQCPLKFKRLSLLAHHERKHSKGEFTLPILKCSTCKEAFSTRKDLETHNLVHEPVNIAVVEQDSKQIINIEITDSIKTPLDASESRTETEDVNHDIEFKSKPDSTLRTRSQRKRKTRTEDNQEKNKKMKQEELSPRYIKSSNSENEPLETADVVTELANQDPSFDPSDVAIETTDDDEEYVMQNSDENEDVESEPPSPTKTVPQRRKGPKGRKKAPRVKTISSSKDPHETSGHVDDLDMDDLDMESGGGSNVKKGPKYKVPPEELAKRLETAKLIEDWDRNERSFEYIADYLGVPEEIRPLLEYSKWPSYLKTGGRFKGKPRQAYRWYYINNFQEFKCDKCDEVFKGKLRYDTHKRKEEGVLWYCSFCTKSFTTKGHLKTHEMRHMEAKNVKCELCEFSCFFKFQLRKHMQNAHGEGGGPTQFLCDKCPKVFKTKQSLEKHELRVHNVEKWKETGHKCPQCKYIGFTAQDVKLHMARHSANKPFVCHVCQRKAFRREKDLRRHLRIDHNQEPKVKSKKLADQDIGTSDDKEEIQPIELLPRESKEDKVFKCPHCDYTAKSSNNLKAHVVIHYNDRPFECPVCHLGFKRKNVMVRHAWRLHKIDLRRSTYEVSEDGKRKRKELSNQLIVVNDTAMAGQIQLLEQVDTGALYEMVGGDGQDSLLTVQNHGLILQEVNAQDPTTIETTATSDHPTNPPDVSLLLSNHHHHGNQDPLSNQDHVREVVVDSGHHHVYVNPPHDQEEDTLVSQEEVDDVAAPVLRTLSVPITDSTGMTSETEIVIDPHVLKAMGLDSFSAAQLKMIADADT